MPEIFTYRSVLCAPARTVFAWMESPAALPAMVPDWAGVTVEKVPENVRPGSTAILRMKVGPFTTRWYAEHVEYENHGDDGGFFVDVQRRGPFAEWTHRHTITARGADRCILEDRVDYQLPGWIFGRLFGGGYTRRRLERMFAWRHAQMVKMFGSPRPR